jgi:RNA polymerase sigma factor (TIGR02999 family)
LKVARSAFGSASEEPASPTPELDEMFAALYADLRRLARRQLIREPAGHTLDTTALVHEAYLRLLAQTHVNWQDRVRLLAVAACAMRRVLVDHARRHLAAKRGGAQKRVTLDDRTMTVASRAEEIVAIDRALDKLQSLDPRLCQVVECRFFSGLTDAETAKALSVTPRTVQRDWLKAKAWLHHELNA